MKPPTPLTASERVARSRTKAIDGGARQINAVLRDAAALAALDALIATHGSVRAALEHALIRAAESER